MNPNTVTILSSLIGVVGSILAVGLGVWIGLTLLEKQELRKHQVDCIVNMYGSRFAMSKEVQSQPEDKSRFHFEQDRRFVLKQC
jgi:hypothetical protein